MGAPAGRPGELVRNAAASQAFVLRRNLVVQFHPEPTGDVLDGFLDHVARGHAHARTLG